MRITIQAPRDRASELEADRELQKAFVVLHAACISTRGGGRFADNAASIIPLRESDASEALAALGKAGIQALMRT